MRLTLRPGASPGPGTDPDPGPNPSHSSDPDAGPFTHQPSFSTISSADTDGDAGVVTVPISSSTDVLPIPSNAVVVSLVRRPSGKVKHCTCGTQANVDELGLSTARQLAPLDLARLEAQQHHDAPPTSSASPFPSTSATPATPAAPRAPIPIPPALAALPLFDTFFDLVEADAAGGIETPTPPRLLASVHELVQSITSSETQQPETWVLAREWRDAVRAAQSGSCESAGSGGVGVGGEGSEGSGGQREASDLARVKKKPTASHDGRGGNTELDLDVEEVDIDADGARTRVDIRVHVVDVF